MTTRPHIIGLTGSIGMGKTTTAGFFREKGIPVWDADAAVHRLYAGLGAAVEGIRNICPNAVSIDGVDRAVLRAWIARDEAAITKIESVVHPRVAEDRAKFIENNAAAGHKLVVIDIPLLFETSGEKSVDAVVVVSAPAEVQRKRVLEREGMSLAHFEKILTRQTPDAEKRSRADFVIETTSLESARRQVDAVVTEIHNRIAQNA